jgi:DNA-binding response OmpR family regulator
METVPTQKIKICIVEDEPSIREIYQTVLEGDGFEVFTAEDGERGLEVISAQKPDLALIDMLMPVKDGISLIQDMRKNEELSQIPVIILSNLTAEETVAKRSDLKVQFYLVKSLFTPAQVVRVVREVLHNKLKKKMNFAQQ